MASIDERFSKIETDIEQMNQLIDDNLKVAENGSNELEVADNTEKLPEKESSENVNDIQLTSVNELNEMLKVEIQSSVAIGEPEAMNEVQTDTTSDIENGPVLDDSISSEDKNGVNADLKEESNLEKDIKEQEVNTTANLSEVAEKDDIFKAKEADVPEIKETEVPEVKEIEVEETGAEVPRVEETQAEAPPVEETQVEVSLVKEPLVNEAQTDIPSELQTPVVAVDNTKCEQKPDHVPKIQVPEPIKAQHNVNSSPMTETTEDEVHHQGGSPLLTPSPIVLPKNNATILPTKVTETTTSAPPSRRSANPFRVISVGSSQSRTTSSSSSRNASENLDKDLVMLGNSRVSSTASQVNSESSIGKLQNRQDYLIDKCTKLQKEIDYLKKMNNQAMLSIDDSRKLTHALEKLQEYLDKKNKEKYEVGVLLSRNLRKQIDRGENGEFWISNK